MKVNARVNLDKVGAVASAICAVHCLLTGLALGLLSVVGLGFIGSVVTELVFFLITVSVGITAVVHGRRKHHSVIPAWIFVSGLACLLVSHFVFGHGHGGRDCNLGGTLFSVLGGLSLVVFHVVNQRLQHQCGCMHCHHHE
jgi:hypothetical protein